MDPNFKEFLQMELKFEEEKPTKKNEVDSVIDNEESEETIETTSTEEEEEEEEVETIEPEHEEEEESQEEESSEEEEVDETESSTKKPTKKASTKKESAEEILRKRVAQLTAELERVRNGEDTEIPETSTEKDEEAISFLDDYSDQQIQEAISNPAMMREFMKKALAKVRRQAIDDAVGVATVTANRNLELKSVIQEFYRQNNDLLPYKEMLGYTVNKVQAENPSWNVTDILKEASKRLRKELLISKRVTDVREKRTPAFPSKQKGAGTGGVTKPTGQQKELVDMFKSLK